MTINVYRNKRSDPGAVPGASTISRFPGFRQTVMGAKQDRRARKGLTFVRHGTTDIGPYS